MEERMKIASWFLSALLLMMITGCGGDQTVKIGFIGPLTGDAANYGKLMTQAIKLAVEEKNALGGIGGRKIQFIAEDDEGKVEKANAAIEKLAKVDHIWGFVGAVFSGSSLAIAPKAQESKIVMITPSSTHKDLTSKGDFIFRNVLSDQLQAIVFAKYVKETLKIKKAAILYLKNDYSQGLAEDFKKQFEADGGSITLMESALQGDKDFKTQLTRIKSSSPDALYMPDYVAEMAQIMEQARDIGLKVRFLSADGFSNPEIFELAGDLANGVVFANSADESGRKNPLRSVFEQKYETKWGQKPDSFSLNSYDSANILIQAIEKVYNASSPGDQKALRLDRDKIRAAVAGVSDYPGVSGTITFLHSRDALKNVGIFVAENKIFIQISENAVVNGKLITVQ